MLRALPIALALAAPAVALAQPQIFSNRWDSAEASRFNHVIRGTPGPKTLRLDAVTTAPGGGVTVSVYPVTASGQRGALIAFVIATTHGYSRAASINLPEPRRGEALSSLPVTVVVENASGGRNQGEYTLTVSP